MKRLLWLIAPLVVIWLAEVSGTRGPAEADVQVIDALVYTGIYL